MKGRPCLIERVGYGTNMAPVGRMMLVRIKKDGTPMYKESAQGWFDPESQVARDFIWPK